VKALADALRDRGDQFPIPWPLPAKIYPGFLVEVLAAPKVGKSLLALNWAVDVAERGIPVLYHTPDTDFGSQAQRVVALVNGITQEEVTERPDYWSGWLRGTNLPIRWSTAGVDVTTFEELVLAEKEYLGEYPKLIVVDVAQDILRGQEDVGNVRRIFRTLHNIGRKCGAVVLVLHHVKRGDAADGNQYVGMADGLYGGEQIVEVIISLWREGEGRLAMHLAANRQGPSGQTIHLNVDYMRARIT
jgi:KaiC/GvpD/RAD55 family RecA-like ATPase